MKDILLTALVGYISFFVALFVHESAHSWMAWRKGAADGPLSIRYLPYLFLPISPHLDDDKYNRLPSSDKVKILLAGVGMNLIVWGVSLVLLGMWRAQLPQYWQVFLLFLALANMAEWASYLTVGAIYPISDIKLVLAELPRLSAAVFYLPGVALLTIGIYLMSNLIPPDQRTLYWVYFAVVFLLLSGSRVLLTSN